ncbi:MAG: bifunctional glutamate N-acetyltransferase/amino-acid acetyltransferase ArgJ [Nitrospirae bacterium]|nr:MAG: bifunctional glutamate N-acetyltransferase/amino-acid acetyltransferase ArgJ [Nitrospirota bacterium]
MKTPQGFVFSAVEAAVKKPGRKDLALIYSESECVMAGMFTLNKVKAAPVRLDMQKIRSGKGNAVVVNSGNANACTGVRGMDDAVAMSELTASALGLKPSAVYVCSTGVIGTPMPMDRIKAKIPELADKANRHSFLDVATAIMTTDTFAKTSHRQLTVDGKKITISGVCKGAGMISPNMATMLCFIVTDASVQKAALQSALKNAVNRSFNLITIDGDMSTNDTVLAMANGAAENIPITLKSPSYPKFESALSTMVYELSKMIVKDGEGATKLIEINIKNAKNEKEGAKAAFAIANSMLVKTAFYGNDANWGRIMAAIGRAGIDIKEDRIDIFINGVKVVSRGTTNGKDAEANRKLRTDEVKLVVDLKLAKNSTRVLTCDFSEDYVRINAEYRT